MRLFLQQMRRFPGAQRQQLDATTALFGRAYGGPLLARRLLTSIPRNTAPTPNRGQS